MRKLILTFALYILLISHCGAQWEPDMRLTIDPAASFTCFNQARCVSSSGDSLHIVWFDIRDGNNEIYYKRSTNSGINWGADTKLTNNPASSLYPAVSTFESVVHVVWFDNRDGDDEIYYKRSTNAGISWEADVRLTNNSFSQIDPSLSISGQVVHIVWRDLRDGNAEIYYKRSTDGGVSWEPDIRLTNNSANSYLPSVSVFASDVHVVWEEYRDGNAEVYYKRSTNGGVSWEPDTRLTNNPSNSYRNSVSEYDSVVHVVWYDGRDGNNEIYYKRSTDRGANWGADTRLTNNSATSFDPGIFVSGANVHIVWFDNRDGNNEIYYKYSTDGGASWGADTRLTNNTAASNRPSISVSRSILHVVWYDNRDGNNEIYYKRNPNGNVVGIKQINTGLSEYFSLYQNYPNPFNPSTVISFQLAVNSFASLKIYDLLGREFAALVNEQLQPGTYEVEFDGTNYPSGIYYYRLITNGFSETKKMLMIK